MFRFGAACLVGLCCACGGKAAEPANVPVEPTDPKADHCAASEIAVGDACVAAGIGVDDCGAGFRHDGDVGCTPTLPSQPCATGMMAVPGDASCRPVMDCVDISEPATVVASGGSIAQAIATAGDGDLIVLEQESSLAAGVVVHPDHLEGQLATLNLRNATIGNADMAGVTIFGEASLDDVVIEGTRAHPVDGTYGDGLQAMTFFPNAQLATATLRKSRIAKNHRAAATAFGAPLSIAESTLDCNPIDLVGQNYQGFEFELIDGGGNPCGCGAVQRTCKLSTATLEPPPPPPNYDP